MVRAARFSSNPGRLEWRRWVSGRVWVRHPVSITRHRLTVVLVVVLLCGVGLYLFRTRDEAIRSRVVEFLSEATGGQVSVGAARFHMFGGITLYDVQVSVPFDDKLDPSAADALARQIFFASSVKLIHNPWRLLFGALRVEQIVAAQPKITLMHNVDTGLRNWQLLAGVQRTPRRRRTSTLRPGVTIRSAKVAAVSVYADGRHEARTEELDADVRPHPQSDTGFCIEVRRFSEPAERTTVVFDPGARLVTNTPYVDARTVRLQLPKAAQQFFDQINLQGEVKLDRLVYAAGDVDRFDTEIELRHVRCTVPLSMLRSGHSTSQPTGIQTIPPSQPTSRGAPSTAAPDGLITLTDASGHIALRGGRLEADISGLVGGAKCAVKGTLSDVERPLSEMGIDVRVQGTRIPAPEGIARRHLLADPAVPGELKAFFEDYDPRGVFDVDLRLVRAVGAEERMALHGVLKPLAATGKCRWFPYALRDLEGRVRFERDHVLVERLTGRHGDAEAQIDARIDLRPDWADISVDIFASSVALDDDLFSALSSHDRALWSRFNPRGAASLAVRLRRPKGGAERPVPAWQSRVTADLANAELEFSEYPYPLQNVEGRIVIENDNMQFINVVGRRGPASLRVDGRASVPVDRPATVELRLDARDVPLDPTLAGALQAEGRGAFEQFQPQGRIDLSGTVAVRDPAEGITYDLRAKVSDAAICYQQFPYRMTDVNGEVLIRPNGYSLIRVSGRHGDAKGSVTGDIRREEHGYIADLIFDCENLALGDELYTALPNRFKEVWNFLSPKGIVHIQTALHQVAVGDRFEQRHRSRIAASDAAMCLAPLPLHVEGLTGEVVITDDKVEVTTLRGMAEGGRIELSGAINLSDETSQGAFALKATGLTLSPGLLAAFPAHMRAALEACKPSGQFDLRLDPLTFDVGDSGRRRWTFQGELKLHDASADLGFELRDATGTLSGSGRVDPDAGLSFSLQSNLDRVAMAGWKLERLVGRIAKEAGSRRIELRDASAEVYGGQATGGAKFNVLAFIPHAASAPDGRAATLPSGAEYQVSIVTRDMQLGRCLAKVAPAPAGADTASTSATTMPAQKPAESAAASGTIDGSLILRGKTGSGAYREGSGEVFVRHAQVWRLPLLFLIFQVLNLTPDENVFHDGWLRFDVSGDTVRFHRILLQGRALSFIGEGTMDISSRALDVTLLARSPVRLHLPLLTDLLELFAREFMEVKVSGTLEKPTIRPRPLRTLTNVAKVLLIPPTPRDRPVVTPPAASQPH
jgi:hypothetical protein